jgi:hypothetical protein
MVGNVSGFQARGDVNQLLARMLYGNVSLPVPSTVNNLYFAGWTPTSQIIAPLGTLIKQLLLAKSPTYSTLLNNLPVQGIVLVMANFQDADKNSRSFWMDKAAAAIGQIHPSGTDRLSLGIARNKKITAAYAKLFADNHERFPWLGLAAFASREVGSTISFIRNEMIQARKDGNRKLAKTLEEAGKSLDDGNGAVFDDIYWQFLAYVDGGIDQMRKLNDTKDGKGKPMLSDDDLKAWELIAEGEKKKDPNKIWDGNLKLFFKEQHDILQPLVFDKVSAQFAGKFFKNLAAPLFTGAPKFNGDNLADFDQRFKWISDLLWPQWRKFNEANSDWKVGNNPIKNAMQRFIDIGKEGD